MGKKYIYFFGDGAAEGKAEMKKLLGGKGANLAEMTNMGIPVPPGFTISTEACIYYQDHKKYPPTLEEEIEKNLKRLEKSLNKKFGDGHNPLLVSVRSGAAVSMPGMMDTILNLGLNDETVKGLIAQSNNERFAYDAYRRFVQMFGDVVLGAEHKKFEEALTHKKDNLGVKLDTQLNAKALKDLVAEFKEIIEKTTGRAFPQKPHQQLEMAIKAVLNSWGNKRAITYRKLNNIPDNLGTAVNIQTMVFGNMGDDSGTGVAFTRDPGTGQNKFYGEYLMNAQGEDVVAGIRTPHPILDLKKESPDIYNQLIKIQSKLEKHYKDMQDLEFTIEKGKLYLLQTRTGKRTAASAVKIAVDMVGEKLINRKEAVLRIDPEQLDKLLHPMFDPQAEKNESPMAKGLPASPGAATGQVVFTAEDAEKGAAAKKNVILCRIETSPEDIGGMNAAKGILTSRGGMTCIAGDTSILTDKGFFTAEEAFYRLSKNERLNILSYDCKSSLLKWKKIIATGRRKSKVIKIKVSQTARTRHNFLKITPDHKMYTFQNRKLIKKRLNDILNDKEYICLIDKIPQPKTLNSANDVKLAYLVGAILTDGYKKKKRTKGYVTFTQKRTSKKEAFIEQVNSYFYQVFDTKFSPPRVKISSSYLRGRHIQGEVLDLISSKKRPAEILTNIRNNLVSWALTLNEISSLNFLAGAIDGDGTFHSYENNRIMLYASKEPLAQAIIVTCLKLGIVPQVTVNRNIYNIQILEKLDKILSFTKRVKGSLRKRVYGTKLFAARSIFSDIIDKVNFIGRPKECLKRNLLIDAEKIKRDILPICSPNPLRPQLENVLNSNLRMYRVEKVRDKKEMSFVYNFEVDSRDEMDKNYVIFTKMYTPLLVSNSHAAVVARGMGKCCVAGAGEIQIDYKLKKFKVGSTTVKESDWISINGSTGNIYVGKLPTVEPLLSSDFGTIMKWADKYRKLGIRANADTPHDTEVAVKFGAEGIGLCRTEHMFFEGKRIIAFREMILAENEEGRRKALKKLLPMQRKDFEEIFEALKGRPCTIRLLDPPLHEFLPHDKAGQKEISKVMGISLAKIKAKVESLKELNPMLGHRGCRLGLVYPDISEMQIRAIIEAAFNVKKKGIKVIPEIMIPLVGHFKELKIARERAEGVIQEVFKEKKGKINYKIGTMIEVPRAAVTADEIARQADFFSFGTNDLTQMGCGFSRDDAGRFLPSYVSMGIYEHDPFRVLDAKGVGKLLDLAVKLGKKANKNLKIGICGEHGGEPTSVKFCHRVGLDYVSCSPFRVPIARLAAAQAALEDKNK